MIDLKSLYQNSCDNTSSDIFFHLPILLYYAKKCNHITEMGARGGNSTKTFLYANPKKFISYDYQYTNPEPHLVEDINNLISIFEECKKIGINCEYIGADVLNISIEETDFLFLDTWHCYDQLKGELNLHASKAKKYIAFHDTFTYGEVGEGSPLADINHPQKNNLNGLGGIRKAIDEFLLENKNWEIVYETKENNGLIIIHNKDSI
jgi:hypothetical protein